MVDVTLNGRPLYVAARFDSRSLAVCASSRITTVCPSTLSDMMGPYVLLHAWKSRNPLVVGALCRLPTSGSRRGPGGSGAAAVWLRDVRSHRNRTTAPAISAKIETVSGMALVRRHTETRGCAVAGEAYFMTDRKAGR